MGCQQEQGKIFRGSRLTFGCVNDNERVTSRSSGGFEFDRERKIRTAATFHDAVLKDRHSIIEVSMSLLCWQWSSMNHLVLTQRESLRCCGGTGSIENAGESQG